MLTVGFQGFSVFANNRPGTCYACALQQETTRGSKTSAVALATQEIETISVVVNFSIVWPGRGGMGVILLSAE